MGKEGWGQKLRSVGPDGEQELTRLRFRKRGSTEDGPNNVTEETQFVNYLPTTHSIVYHLLTYLWKVKLINSGRDGDSDSNQCTETLQKEGSEVGYTQFTRSRPYESCVR